MSLPHTLSAQDVQVWLRPGSPQLVSVAEKEALLRRGVSYGTLLTPEAPPSDHQVAAYHAALERNGERTGRLVAALTRQILQSERPVAVSLARAGTPVGCALRRLARHWGRDLPHHTLSIIRGEGIDRAALAAVQQAHPGADLFFVDGWTGKGSISITLSQSLPSSVPPRLAVLSDPAGVAELAATHDDLLLPHAALNATVCGLLSRTFVEDDAAGQAPAQQGGGSPSSALHAARVEEALRPLDQTAEYLDALENLGLRAGPGTLPETVPRPSRPWETVLERAAAAGVTNPHLVKPGVGEATRVFLRREPAGLLLRSQTHPDTQHLLDMAQQRGVPVHIIHDLPYLAAAWVSPGDRE
ncbi:cysteine protease StiP domain-containing protein [Deinococcus lacus]|uniref:Cysteine protease StiP domain-containing protein n=1 Tax=Deinococcus lacus TaxID=392561 RepID=A0ABW1YEK9_9DEIO